MSGADPVAPGPPAGPEHRHVLRVRYAESDQMGYAHHAAYVIWMELARIEWLRAAGASYRELEASGILMPVIACAVRYRRPLRFDDQVELTTRITASGPSRLTFATAIALVGGELCAEGEVTIATVNREGRPMRMPARLLEQLVRA
jgi:acyl-CoA thioester hydrolase